MFEIRPLTPRDSECRIHFSIGLVSDGKEARNETSVDGRDRPRAHGFGQRLLLRLVQLELL
jgi:hypothetical protein